MTIAVDLGRKATKQTKTILLCSYVLKTYEISALPNIYIKLFCNLLVHTGVDPVNGPLASQLLVRFMIVNKEYN